MVAHIVSSFKALTALELTSFLCNTILFIYSVTFFHSCMLTLLISLLYKPNAVYSMYCICICTLLLYMSFDQSIADCVLYELYTVCLPHCPVYMFTFASSFETGASYSVAPSWHDPKSVHVLCTLAPCRTGCQYCSVNINDVKH